MTKRVLVVGGGGREHALAWAIARGRADVRLICAPGNGGTAAIAENVSLDVTDAAGVATVARQRAVDLVVIGPDAAAAAGVADACSAMDIPVFGPTAAAARIESSKRFAKQLMDDAGIATARWVSGAAHDVPKLHAFIDECGGRCAVKADGLALGKGVIVCDSREEARIALDACFSQRRFGAAADVVIVEERLEGRELSVFGISDGHAVRTLLPARDHKRAYEGDAGPNTGGMGAIAPAPGSVSDALLDDVHQRVLAPCIDALRVRGTPFVGCLYAGLMLTAEGMRVLEFNARVGDPEAQVVLPLLDEPALELFEHAAHGALDAGRALSISRWAVGVVAAARGYPGEARTGDVISGLDELDSDVLCFHAGTRRDDAGQIITNGGRVLSLVARAAALDDARQHAYENLSHVHFDGMWFRRDIAATASAVSPALSVPR